MNPGESLLNESQTQKTKFLQFQLGTNIYALLEAKIVKEIITVPEKEIVPVPEMPNWVIGIYGYRSEMLWIIDLKALLDYASFEQSSLNNTLEDWSLMTMAVYWEDQALGLVVPNVQGIVEYHLKDLKPTSPELFSKTMVEFIEGNFGSTKQEMYLLLNPQRLFQQQKEANAINLQQNGTLI